MTIDLHDHERLDDLLTGGMKIIQRDDEFCFSLDTVLLAHFGTVPKGPVLDLGTGTAAIPLLLPARGATDIVAAELNPVMADIARRNVAMNGKASQITVIEEDYRHIGQWAESGQFSFVYANPPYRELFRGAYSKSDGVRRARHEETASLTDVMTAAKYALKYHGRFRLVHITERLPQILAALRSAAMEPKLLRFVYGTTIKESKIFLLEAVRGGSPGLSVAAPLIVHEADGSYSAEVLQLYGRR